MGRGECKGGEKGKNVLAKISGLCYTNGKQKIYHFKDIYVLT